MPETHYHFAPNEDESYYRQRTDRNVGWITEEEQGILKNSVVGIAGCGGMGGLLAATLVRLGVGEIRIADNEVFGASNINRQFGATRNSIGISKVLETARMLRDISDDTSLIAYPRGITEENVEQFVNGCDVVCDEIEFWAIGSRVLLHKEARRNVVSIFNCNSVGFGTRLFLFEPDGYTIEEQLGFSLEQALEFQRKIQSKTATAAEVRSVMDATITGLIDRLPEYSTDTSVYNTIETCLTRLSKESTASIIATNPPMACGFLANHVLFYLLRNSAISRTYIRPAKAPGYLLIDAAFLEAREIKRRNIPR